MKGFFYCACLCTPSITSRICGTTFSLAGVRMFLCLTDISQPRSQGLSIFRSHLPHPKTRDPGNEVEIRVRSSSYQQPVEIIIFCVERYFLFHII